MPEHIEINFGVTDPADRQPGDPVMYIVPVTAYEQMWDQAGNSYVTMTTHKIYTWTVAIQSPPPTAGLPALPPEQITGYNDLAVQIGRAQSDVDSASRSGYRFVGRWAQDANPVTAESRLWYTYQGFTNDGQYLVNFFYPVTTAKLPKQPDMTAADWDKFNTDPQAYIKAQAEMLNALAPADWQPDLSQLDALVGSLQIQGMPQSGLHDVVWQWTGSTYQGKENRIADPSLYEVAYGSDGALSVKADCNRASGTYTYNGGMVGSVRVTMGPMTLAACGPDSRSEELINSLMAAQDYRVQPGGSELKLDVPAGGPVLNFQTSGARERAAVRRDTCCVKRDLCMSRTKRISRTRQPHALLPCPLNRSNHMRKKQAPLAAGLALGVGLVVLLAAAFSGALTAGAALPPLATTVAPAATPAPVTQSGDPARDTTTAAVNLQAGYIMDPYLLPVIGKSEKAAADLQGGCNGYVSAAPNVVVNWAGATDQLNFFIYGDADAALVISGRTAASSATTMPGCGPPIRW